jgi:exoribonuclease R
MSKAKYSTDNIGHYSIRLLLSFLPIRRYPDVMVHRFALFRWSKIC